MGKKLVVLGADFSENGMISPNVKELIRATGVVNPNIGTSVSAYKDFILGVDKLEIDFSFPASIASTTKWNGIFDGTSRLQYQPHLTRFQRINPYQGEQYFVLTNQIADGNVHKMMFDGDKFKVDNEEFTMTIETKSIVSMLLLYIPYSGRNDARIHGIKFAKANGEIIAHFMPALDGDGVPCFIDVDDNCNPVYNTDTGTLIAE